jgi:hypothetical protein
MRQWTACRLGVAPITRFRLELAQTVHEHEHENVPSGLWRNFGVNKQQILIPWIRKFRFFTSECSVQIRYKFELTVWAPVTFSNVNVIGCVIGVVWRFTNKNYWRFTLCRLSQQCYFHAFNSTQKQTAQLEREVVLQIVTEWTDKEKIDHLLIFISLK